MNLVNDGQLFGQTREKVECAENHVMRSFMTKDSRTEAFYTLVARGVLKADEMARAVSQWVRGGDDLEDVLMKECEITPSQLGNVLGDYYGCPYLPFDRRVVVSPELVKHIKPGYMRRNRWVPIKRKGSLLQIVIDDPRDLYRVQEINQLFSGASIELAVGLRADIMHWLDAVTGAAPRESIEDILGELVRDIETAARCEVANNIDENNSAIVRLTNQVISEAYRLGASDIHLEPYSARKDMVVRFRVDGTCFTYMSVPAAYRRAMVSRIKIMANLDIAETRKPQDGKIVFSVGEGRDLDLRVATLPTAGHNEDVVMRILTGKGLLPLESMDLSAPMIRALGQLVSRPYGILLCVGPTGSGKTTTLHALLSRINDDQRKIWTVEDPIEITQEGLRQLQVHPKIGLTFATAMRAFLRADPDVIMVGEMRDKETADIAIEASLTGHLVLSTLHTNSAVETVTRLLDMGCDAFNFADAMLGVLAKRLCKRLCERCKEPYRPSDRERQELTQFYGVSNWTKAKEPIEVVEQLWRPIGCDACNRTGFSGRLALYELLQGSEEMKVLIQSKARTHELFRLAHCEGMTTLGQDGIDKILQGRTTLAEVRKVASK
ncbi:general secretory pathway protein GspE [Nitrospira sp.]|nr:general secretory pathway protein GspE [Nitrospira sp.]